MIPMYRRTILALAAGPLVGCSSAPKVLTDADKNILRRVKTIAVNLDYDGRTLPDNHERAWEFVERLVRFAVSDSGLMLALRGDPADAELKVFVVFVQVARPGSAPILPQMYIQIRLYHEEIGKIFEYEDLVLFPYRENIPESGLLKDLPQILRRRLYRED